MNLDRETDSDRSNLSSLFLSVVSFRHEVKRIVGRLKPTCWPSRRRSWIGKPCLKANNRQYP